MLYLIGGPPRMGKSTLARLVLTENKIPYVSTDGLTVMLKPIGQPSFYSLEKSNLFFPFLELFISRITKSYPDCGDRALRLRNYQMLRSLAIYKLR